MKPLTLPQSTAISEFVLAEKSQLIVVMLMVSCSFRICAGSVNKLVINQLYHSVAEVLLYKKL